MSADPSPEPSPLDRRGFLFLAATAAVACGCEAVSSPSAGSGSGGGTPHLVDAGPASAYAGEGVYEQYKEQGFFLVRRGSQLTAVSSYCTHRHCKLEAEKDRTFYCPCHGSTFDPVGKVTAGPAVRNLPAFAVATDARGHAIVTVVG